MFPVGEPAPNVTLPDGYQADMVVKGLLGPTPMIPINNGTLWIAAGPDILRAAIIDATHIGPLEVALADLPNNGRSNGTLTNTPDGGVLYATSSPNLEGDSLRSGWLWELNTQDITQPRPVATGISLAYAHVFDAQGRLWVTNVTNDIINDKVPPDSLDLVLWHDVTGLQCFSLSLHFLAEREKTGWVEGSRTLPTAKLAHRPLCGKVKLSNKPKPRGERCVYQLSAWMSD